MGNLFVSRFRDGCSIGGAASNDLILALKSGLFADNTCHSAKPGNVVLVVANPFVILLRVLSENLGPSTIWEEKGGSPWRNSYKVARLTPMMDITYCEKIMQSLCEKYKLPFRGKNGNVLLFHGNRFNGGNNKTEYVPVIRDFIKERRAAVSPALPW